MKGWRQMIIYSLLVVMRIVLTTCAAVLCIATAQCEGDERIVRLLQGLVKGYKDPEHDLFKFYGIPYATAPTGPHKFKAPLPEPTWSDVFEAVNKDVICPQLNIPALIGHNKIAQEDCLIANVFVPDTTETNLSVLVNVHGGGFEIGHGNYVTGKRLLLKSKRIILVTFNYRLGVHGFLCLGTDDAPGNAGLKDQVALLRWVKKNIANFGGNPDDVTLSGYSAGSSSVDLLMLSPSAKGLFNKVIPESGASLAAIGMQTNPIENAKKHARSLNFTKIDDIFALEHFYKTTSLKDLIIDIFVTRTDGSFVFSPCVERKTNEEPFLEDTPFNILRSGNYEKLPMLYGFANMEGLLRMNLFDIWKDKMNEKFSDSLSSDLQFEDEVEKQKVAKRIKEFYFGDKLVSKDTVLEYIDYFSDIYFTFSTLWAVKLQVEAGNNKIYLYEYSFTDEEDDFFLVPHTNNTRGAGHCAQTRAVFDLNPLRGNSEDNITEEYKKHKVLMRELWSNFILTGTPVPEGSPFPAWPPTGASGSPHMSLGHKIELRGTLLPERARFWHDIYAKHYRAPQPPPTPPPRKLNL